MVVLEADRMIGMEADRMIGMEAETDRMIGR